MLSDLVFHISPAYAIANEIADDCHYIIISSGDRYDELAKLPNVLLLHFADTEVEGHPFAISKDDAVKIFSFLENCSSEDVFCACDAGESRSAAVAAALTKCAGQDDSWIWQSKEYRPNRLVYETILRYFAFSG